MKLARSIAGQVFRRAKVVARRLGLHRIEASYDRALGEAESDRTLAEQRPRAARSALRKVEYQ